MARKRLNKKALFRESPQDKLVKTFAPGEIPLQCEFDCEGCGETFRHVVPLRAGIVSESAALSAEEQFQRNEAAARRATFGNARGHGWRIIKGFWYCPYCLMNNKKLRAEAEHRVDYISKVRAGYYKKGDNAG